MTSYKSMAKAAALISALSIVSKILGFGREMALAATFGASYQTDAYLVAVLIPTAIFGNIFGTLRTTIVPVYTKTLQGEPEEARRLVVSLLIVVGALAVFTVISGLLLAPYVIRFLAPGFAGETYDLTVRLARVAMPVVLFIALGAVTTGVLHSHNSFLLPAAVGFPYNVILIAGILYFGPRYGIIAAAVALVLAIASQFFLQVPGLVKLTSLTHVRFQIYHPGLKEIAILTSPILIGLLGNEINLIVDRIMASTLEEGSIAALNFANRLWQMPNSLFGVALVTVFYPQLARLAAAADYKEFRNCLQKAVTAVLFLLTPMMVGFIVLRTPIVQVLFERGAFDRAATEATAIALLFYSLGLVAVGLRGLLARTFYSLHDTKTPVIVSLGCIGLNILLNLILIRYLGHAGLALATSIANTAGLIPMFFLLRQKIGSIKGKKITRGAVKIICASVVMGIMVWYLNIQLIPIWAVASVARRIALLFSIISAGALTYFALSYLFGIDELTLVLRALRQKLSTL